MSRRRVDTRESARPTLTDGPKRDLVLYINQLYTDDRLTKPQWSRLHELISSEDAMVCPNCGMTTWDKDFGCRLPGCDNYAVLVENDEQGESEDRE